MHVVVIKAGEGRTIPLGPIHMVVQEDGTQTRERWALLNLQWLLMLPHRHLISTMPMKRDFTSWKANWNFWLGTIHTFSNPTDKPARFLNTFTPPLYIGYFEAFSELLQADGALSPQHFAALMARYDTEVVA